ncbi:lipid II flippase Amj family protein [Clostridium estertheticum]|nr:lipid II flippase Amj family protein [Clostridium estertheticum]
MSTQVIIVLILTIIISIISTLAYSVRIVGVRTGGIAVSFAVFNIFTLVSRTSNSLLVFWHYCIKGDYDEYTSGKYQDNESVQPSLLYKDFER